MQANFAQNLPLKIVFFYALLLHKKWDCFYIFSLEFLIENEIKTLYPNYILNSGLL